jgi:hypothetical protein
VITAAFLPDDFGRGPPERLTLLLAHTDEDTGNTFEVRLSKGLDDAIYSAREVTISQRALCAQRALAIASE